MADRRNAKLDAPRQRLEPRTYQFALPTMNSGQFVPFRINQAQPKSGEWREISLPASRALKLLGTQREHTSPRRLIGQSLRTRQRQMSCDEESKFSMSLKRPRKAAQWRRGLGDPSLYVRRSPLLGLISISRVGSEGRGARESRLQIGRSAFVSLLTFPIAACGGCNHPDRQARAAEALFPEEGTPLRRNAALR